MDEEYKKMLLGVKIHLIKSHMTYNAEVEPVVVRPVNVDMLVASIWEYLTGAGYASTSKIS